MTATQKDASMLKTNVQRDDTGRQLTSVESVPKRNRGIVPWLLGSGILAALFFLVAAGAGVAYYKGWIFNRTAVTDPKPSPTATAQQVTKPDMVEIPGGTFTMGRNDGLDEEKPEHEVTVQTFWMDRTEVTNREFHKFMTDSGYEPLSREGFLIHWVNNAPKPGDEDMPVRFVNIEDVEAFAAWRSKRDGVTYRLPTEKEWEYAARSGSKNYLYPWGNDFRASCAVVDQSNDEPLRVNSRSCPNQWGVQDLIGNVLEWTADVPWLYPGSQGSIEADVSDLRMVRGGSARYPSTGEKAATSTYRTRTFAPKTMRHDALGFRLVR
jgi:formylglycine-generating enzyme required for sulfatase activity